MSVVAWLGGRVYYGWVIVGTLAVTETVSWGILYYVFSVFLVPMLAWRLGIPLWQAFLYDLGLLLFFLVYTYVFTWGFDRVFGLPASARQTNG